MKELGNIETPIVLISTPNVASGIYIFSFKENGDVRSENAVVEETNDRSINDIQVRFVKPADVF